MSAGNLRFKGVIAGGLTGVAIAMAAAFILPPDYSGKVRIQQASHNGATESDLPLASQIEILKSRETLYPVINELALETKWKATRPEAYAMLVDGLKLHPIEGTAFSDIEFRSNDPEEVAGIANGIARSYLKRREEIELPLAYEKINAQESLLEENVEDARMRIIELMEELNIVDLADNYIEWESAEVSPSENLPSNGSRSILFPDKARIPTTPDLRDEFIRRFLAAASLHYHKTSNNYLPEDRSLGQRNQTLRVRLIFAKRSIESLAKKDIDAEQNIAYAQLFEAKKDHETQGRILADWRASLEERILENLQTEPAISIITHARQKIESDHPNIAFIATAGLTSGALLSVLFAKIRGKD